MYNIKLRKQHFSKTFCRFSLEQNFLEKLPNVAFVYLLCPIVLKYFKKYSLNQITRYKAMRYMGVIGLQVPLFPEKEFFGKLKCQIYLPIVSHYAT